MQDGCVVVLMCFTAGLVADCQLVNTISLAKQPHLKGNPYLLTERYLADGRPTQMTEQCSAEVRGLVNKMTLMFKPRLSQPDPPDWVRAGGCFLSVASSQYFLPQDRTEGT